MPVFAKSELSEMKPYQLKALQGQITKALAKAHDERLARYIYTVEGYLPHEEEAEVTVTNGNGEELTEEQQEAKQWLDGEHQGCGSCQEAGK